MKRRGEKIMKSHAGWRKADFVKRLKIGMTVVGVALCFSLAAGAILAWLQIRGPLGRAPAGSGPAVSSGPASSGTDVLPVYDDSYNLLVVNAASPLESGYSVKLASFEGVQVDERIVPALRKMVEDARAQGHPLKLSGGYVSAAEQDELFQAEVQKLKQQGYTEIRAENQAQLTVGKAGSNENQTGMAVEFSADGAAGSDFSKTAQYRWLVKNCVSYGFVLRYPEDKTEETGVAFRPGHFRYVGTGNAVKMREYGMCLEEYASYRQEQEQN